MDWRVAVAVLAASIVGIIYRAPNLILHPRLWAEEGSWFFRFAYEHSFFEGLTFVLHTASYFVFSTNLLTTVATHTVPLEWAPHITMWGAFAIQLIPLTLVLFGRSALFSTPWRRVTGCAILLFAPSHSATVWLTSLHSQVYWGTAAVLIMLEDLADLTPARTWVYRLLLASAAVSSIYVSFLLPAFLLRAWRQRKREGWVQLGIVGAAVLLQALIVLSFAHDDAISRKRFSHLEVETLVFAAEHQIAYPLFGWRGINAIAEVLGSRLAPAFLGLALVGITLPIFGRARDPLGISRATLGLGFLSVFFATWLSSLNGKPGGRYAVVSGFIVLFIVLAGLPEPLRVARWRAIIPIMLLGLALGSGWDAYRDAYQLKCDGASSGWLTEVQRWREHPNHEIRICPEGWVLKLAGSEKLGTNSSGDSGRPRD